jgi:hypothetical protein
MSVNSKINNAIKHIAPIQAGTYTPKDPKEIYIVFNYDSDPADHADDEPQHEIFYIQVHLFCPARFNSLAKRRAIKQSLFAAGFTFPKYIDATDSDGQHHVFECQITAPAGGE